MLKGFRGKQAIMESALIKKQQGYLGTYRRKLNPGGTPTMVLDEMNEGQFWINDSERQLKRYDASKSEIHKEQTDQLLAGERSCNERKAC